MQASRLTTIKVIGTIVALFCAYNAHAKLQSLDDGNLEKIAGAEGIGIILKDISVGSEGNTTLHVDFGVKTISLYGDKFNIHDYKDPSKGFTIGTVANPISFNILASDSTQMNMKGDSGIDVRYLRIALPTAEHKNKTLHAAGAFNDSYTNLPTTTYATKADSSMQWVTVPFACNGTAPQCLSLAVRLRADIYKGIYTKDTTNNALLIETQDKLVDRKLLWTKVEGVSLNGSYFDIWGDPSEGMALSANISAYINKIHLTNRTDYKNGTAEPTPVATGEILSTATSKGETGSTLALTPPYSNDYTAKFDDSGKDTGLQLSGVYVDAHIGNKFYQPLSIQTVVTPISRDTPSASTCTSGTPVTGDDGNSYCPDVVTSDLRLKLNAINNSTYKRFYKDQNTKSNIHVREVKMGAGENDHGYTNPNANGYNFGSLTIEGLRIQHLNFTTRDLKPLTRNHCPSGWSCSF